MGSIFIQPSLFPEFAGVRIYDLVSGSWRSVMPDGVLLIGSRSGEVVSYQEPKLCEVQPVGSSVRAWCTCRRCES